MTNVVRKGANRASHEARRARAAQRTPLPPKGAKSFAGKGTTAEVIKDELERKPKKAAKTKPTKAPDAKPSTNWLPSKVVAYCAAVDAAGWERRVDDRDGAITVTATRDGEQVRVTFTDGNWSVLHRQVYIRPDGSEVLLRNASAAKKQMASEPDSRPIPAERSTVRRSRKTTAAERAAEEEPVRRLPFDPQEISDDDLLALFVKGVRLRTRNSVSGAIEETVVPPRAHGLRVEANRVNPNPERRAVHFLSAEGQWRAVSLRTMLRCEPLTAKDGAKVLTDILDGE